MKTIIFELLLMGTILFAIAVGLSIKTYLEQQKTTTIKGEFPLWKFTVPSEEITRLEKNTFLESSKKNTTQIKAEITEQPTEAFIFVFDPAKGVQKVTFTQLHIKGVYDIEVGPYDGLSFEPDGQVYIKFTRKVEKGKCAAKH